MNELTEKEHCIMRLLAEGKRDREIAEALGLRPRTVTHRVRIACEKLGARTRAQAVVLYLSNG